jgi:hypothetical protein
MCAMSDRFLATSVVLLFFAVYLFAGLSIIHLAKTHDTVGTDVNNMPPLASNPTPASPTGIGADADWMAMADRFIRILIDYVPYFIAIFVINYIFLSAAAFVCVFKLCQLVAAIRHGYCIKASLTNQGFVMEGMPPPATNKQQ